MGLKGTGSITNRDGPGPGEYMYKTEFSNIKGPVTFGKFTRLNNLKGRGASSDGIHLIIETFNRSFKVYGLDAWSWSLRRQFQDSNSECTNSGVWVFE